MRNCIYKHNMHALRHTQHVVVQFHVSDFISHTQNLTSSKFCFGAEKERFEFFADSRPHSFIAFIIICFRIWFAK